MARDQWLKVRMSAGELAQVREHARAQHTTVSAAVRFLLRSWLASPELDLSPVRWVRDRVRKGHFSFEFMDGDGLDLGV